MRKSSTTFLVTMAGLAAISMMAGAQSGVSVGDMVETNVNGLGVTGEVIRSNGALADLNLGQNNVSKFLSVEYMRVVQKAGAGGKTSFAVGDVVQVQSTPSVVLSGRIMKTNGAYCEIDSSGSGFTGWRKCAELRSASAARGATAPAGRGTAAARGATAAPASAAKPPKPGLTSCAGKFEGRYAASSGLGNFTIVFRAGKATLKGPLVDDEETECWMGGGKIYLHKPGESEDLPIDINDDGTLDTPFGELKKKSS